MLAVITLIISRISVLNAQIICMKFNINEWKNQFLFNQIPNDTETYMYLYKIRNYNNVIYTVLTKTVLIFVLTKTVLILISYHTWYNIY